MTPLPKFVLDTIIKERKEAALGGQKVSAEGVADRWMANHKIVPLLPADQTLRKWLHAHVTQVARTALGDVRDNTDRGSS